MRYLDEARFRRVTAYLEQCTTHNLDSGSYCLDLAVDGERYTLEVLPVKHGRLVAVQAIRKKDGTVIPGGTMLWSLLDVALYPVWSGWREKN